MWNDGEKWNIDDSLTLTMAGVTYTTIITIDNITYIYAVIGNSNVSIHYDVTNNKWILTTMSTYVNNWLCTISVNN